jgi:uncharacterized repeat protein (TIGR01451 family)
MNMKKMAVSIIITAMVVFTVFTGAAAAKSLYVISDTHNEDFDAYFIHPDGTVSKQIDIGIPSHGYGAVGVAIDESSATLFITYEADNTVELVDAITMAKIGNTTAPGASNLAGIDVDDANDIVYTVDRSTDDLYAYDWDPNGPTLTLIGGFPINLTNCQGAYGIALDDTNSILYVADTSAVRVRGYNVTTWTEVQTFTPSQIPVDVAVDKQNGFIYTTAPDSGCAGSISGSNILVKIDIATGTETNVSLGDHGSMGVAVDCDTGLVYVTCGCAGNNLEVWNTSTWAKINDTGEIGAPAGICIPQAEIGYSPLNITKTDDVADGDCVDPDGTITYEICYDNEIGRKDVTNVVITDTLPAGVSFVSATGGGTYNAGTHTVTWNIGTVLAGASEQCVYLEVTVNAGTGGTTLENHAEIDGDEVSATEVYEYTDVCYQPLNITKTDDVSGCAVVGDTITYTICYDNLQNPYAAVHNVVINDTLPSGVNFASAPGGIYNPSTRTVTWTIGDLAGGAEACVTLQVVAYAGTWGATLENCAIIDSTETDPTEACAETDVCEREPRPPMQVPTLTPQGIVLMIGLLAVVGSVMLRRRE